MTEEKENSAWKTSSVWLVAGYLNWSLFRVTKRAHLVILQTSRSGVPVHRGRVGLTKATRRVELWSNLKVERFWSFRLTYCGDVSLSNTC
uniref:Uncharacterized protein n=1 Tax=Mycena chlorophos TaxID=658473 RepID=A0ABQ0KXA0_MYCCL|nr:predicted protein [Mycena chlorophos]